MGLRHTAYQESDRGLSITLNEAGEMVRNSYTGNLPAQRFRRGAGTTSHSSLSDEASGQAGKTMGAEAQMVTEPDEPRVARRSGESIPRA